METLDKRTNLMEALKDSMTKGDAEGASKALLDYDNQLKMDIQKKFEMLQGENDSKVLASRGIRQLTTKEKAYYEGLIKAFKSENPKMAITNYNVAMPETVIDDVFRNLTDEHPLLAAINFVPTGYLTKWLVNDHSAS